MIKTKAVVAVARELARFVWAIGQEVQTAGWQGIKTAAASGATACSDEQTNTAYQGHKTGGAQHQKVTQMPEGERGAAAATGGSSNTLLVGLVCGNA